jgi:hypothetical protein
MAAPRGDYNLPVTPLMSLAPGTRLGQYEILSALGSGGMGEVYRARDTTLERDVALKVVLPAVATDPDRVARFNREARVLASLNHPNIAQIHGLESSGSVPAIVMELAEGPTLADRLVRGALPLTEAVNVARQIAEALAAAHEQGVIHRDLKPTNVKVRPDGIVKVLDFGLATWRPNPAHAEPAPDRTGGPTASMETMPGVVLGTAAYMAPEQARGLPVDRRADLWAFGCVLCEMLAGRRAFQGRTLTDLLVNIIEHDPDWHALPATVPTRLRRLLRHCLQKDPAQRLDSATAARLEIVDAMTPEPAATAPPAAAPVTRWRRVAPAAGTAIAAAAAGVLAMWLIRPAPSPSESVTRFEVVPPPEQPIAFSFAAPDLVVSADGARLAYTVGAERRLMVRDFDAVDAVIVPGVEEPVALPQRLYRELDLSPDRRRVAAVVWESGNSDVWLWDLPSRAASSAPTRLTFDPAGDAFPVLGAGWQAHLLLASPEHHPSPRRRRWRR